MLRRIRIGLAIVTFSLLTMLFLDFTGATNLWLGWLTNVQLIPAILALNVGVILFLLIITLAFGRIYCAVICPLGIWQDIVSWFAGKTKKHRFSYSPAMSWMRYLLLGIFVVAMLGGVGSVVALLDPYGTYGRIASNLLLPVYQWGNNLLAYLAQRADSYAFYSVDVWIKSSSAFVVSALTFVIVGILAWKHGRTYCNTICPVGTALGLLSKFSLLKPVFNTDKCNSCNLCARNCKAACIDSKNHTIDYSRCVTCMDCLDTCKRQAIAYKPAYKTKSVAQTEYKMATVASETKNNTRRSFLTVASLLTLTAASKAQENAVEGSLAVIEDKKIPKRTAPITPPGATSAKNFTEHCTACGLCISSCPNNVLRPSSGLITFMQPEMSYERGFCRPECTSCADVCPTSAINPISKEDKSATQIGYAVWIRDNCVVITDDIDCGNCAKRCPVGAIEMVASNPENKKSRTIPVVNTERCIGCGACEYLCPSRPFSAIYVEGTERHRTV